MPIPSSPNCNAACVGCLSFQPVEAGFPSTQNRITFTPTPDEIAELAADRSSLLIHVYDLADEAAFIAHYKRDYELPLKEIFE